VRNPMKSQSALTEEVENRRLALISQENRLRLVLEYLNYNGVLYTLTPHPLVTTQSQSSNRPAS
jgi:hypothetical protein